MNLNFILFPAPRKRYSIEQHKGELIWIPKLIYELNNNNKENLQNKQQFKCPLPQKQQQKQPLRQSQRSQSTIYSNNANFLQSQSDSIKQNNMSYLGKNKFNQTLNTRVQFKRQPIKKSDEMDRTYIEAETIIHNNEENEEFNLDLTQEGTFFTNIQQSQQTKAHSKKEIKASPNQIYIKNLNMNKLYVPLSKECINESFQSCSLLQEYIDEGSQDLECLQSPKNIKNYITRTFQSNNAFVSQGYLQPKQTHNLNDICGTYTQSSSVCDHSLSTNSLNQHHSIANTTHYNSAVQPEAKTQHTQRQPLRSVYETAYSNNHNLNNFSSYNNTARTFNLSPPQQKLTNHITKNQYGINTFLQNNHSKPFDNQLTAINIKNTNTDFVNRDQSNNGLIHTQQIQKQQVIQKDYQFTHIQSQVTNITYSQQMKFCLSEKQKYIPCLFLKSYKASNYVLIYFHGNGEDISLSYELIDHLRRNLKVNVLAVEYQGYGLYEGVPDEDQILKDSLFVYNFLTQKLHFNYKNIMILGRSIGTGPATWLAANKRVGLLILISPFTSIRGVVKHVAGSIAQHLIKERFVNIDNIQNVICPTFIVHGQQDKLIPYKQSQKLHDLCRGPCQLILPKRMSHVELDFYDDLTTPLQGFLIKNGINVHQDNSLLNYNKQIQMPQKLYENPIKLQYE